ncbi:MAG: hypothetical protein ACLUNQ_05015 [Oscillospiraceae bacterium]
MAGLILHHPDGTLAVKSYQLCSQVAGIMANDLVFYGADGA